MWTLAMIAPVPTSSSGSESSLAGPKSSSPSYSSPSKLSSEGSVVSAEVCPSTSASMPIACRRADSGVLGHSFDPLWCPFCPHAKHASAVGMLCLPGTCCPVGIPRSLVRGTATDAEVEGHTSAETTEPSEDNFEGDEYEGEDDFGPAKDDSDPDDDVGTGAIIASVHVEEDAMEDNDEVVYSAAMATANTFKSNDDTAIATKLLQSIKEDYEVQGSGTKPRPIRKMKEQLKANSNNEWASNSNVKPAKSGYNGTTPVNRQGLPALIKINGIEAYMCWDSGL